MSKKQDYKGPQKKVGDILDWTSQSAGYEKRKTGKIVAIVKANEDAHKAVKDSGGEVSTRRILTKNQVAREDRYLVKVEVVKGDPFYYLPICKTIDRGIAAGKKPEDAKRPSSKAA